MAAENKILNNAIVKIGNAQSEEHRLIVYHSDNTSVSIYGYGLYMNRTNSYIRPSNDGSQILAIGTDNNTWNYVAFDVNYFTVSTNASEHFRITNTGNIGIGTTSPGHKLDVGGSININNTSYAYKINDLNVLSASGTYTNLHTPEGAVAIYLGDSGDRTNYYDNNTHRFRGAGGSGDKMFINSSGNVGIGTTSPNHKLDIYSNENVPLRVHRPNNANLDSSGAWGIGFSTRSDGNNSVTDTRAGIFSYYNGNLFLAAANTSIVADPDAYARLTILNSGNVGIGTTSPSYKLDVAGTTRSGSRLTLDSAFYRDHIAVTRGSKGYYLTQSGDTALLEAIGTTDRFDVFGTLQVKTNGNVGIGTTSPAQKLEVSFAGSVYGARFTRNDATGSSLIEFANSAGVKSIVGYDAGIDGYRIGTSTANNLTVKQSGNVGIGTTSPEAKLHVVGDAIFNSRIRGAELGNPDITRNGLTFYVDLNDKASHSGTSSTEIPIDLGPNGYTMALFGGANFEYKNGIGSFYFDNSGDILQIEDFYVGGTANTYEAWVYAENVAQGGSSWDTIWDSGNERPLLGLYEGRPAAYPGTYADVDDAIDTGKWYQLVWAFAGNNDVDVYVNGNRIIEAEDWSDGGSYTQRQGTFTSWIGGDGGVETFQGWIAIARHYDRQLAPEEVLQNYNADIRRFAANTPTLGIVQKGGSVGIGTTNPDQNLHVNSSSTSVTGIAVTNTSSGSSRVYFDASNGDIAGSDYMWIGQYNDLSGEIVMTQSAGAFHIKTQPGGTVSSRLTVLQNGNVGIGTTSPSEKLVVQGNDISALIYDSTDMSNDDESAILKLRHVASTESASTFFSSSHPHAGINFEREWGSAGSTLSTLAKIHTYGETGWGGGLVFMTKPDDGVSSSDPVNVLDLTPDGEALFSGNVGLGTTSPKAALDVKGRFVVDSKTMTITDLFDDALTVVMSNHTGCYVKITAFGDWGSHSSISYLGEFFLNNGAGSYNEPGMIIRQEDNTYNDAIQAQIVDPGGTSGNREFIIQLKATATASFTAYITYTIQGMFVSAS